MKQFTHQDLAALRVRLKDIRPLLVLNRDAQRDALDAGLISLTKYKDITLRAGASKKILGWDKAFCSKPVMEIFEICHQMTADAEASLPLAIDQKNAAQGLKKWKDFMAKAGFKA